MKIRHPNRKIMESAIKLAKTHYKESRASVGAVIVKDNKIIAKGFTTLDRDRISTRHGEINAIEEANKKLGTLNLSGCWLYSTYEPCPMCASASVWARMDGIVYGASMDDRNEKYAQRILISCRDVLKHGTPRLRLYEKFMRKECKELLLL